MQTTSSRLSFAAHAAPMACGSCVPMTDDQATLRTLRSLKWQGICRPSSTSPLFPMSWQTISLIVVPRHSATPISRSAGNTQSVSRSTYAEPVMAASWPVAGHDPILHDRRALLDLVHAEDRDLRVVEDRGRQQTAPGARAGDRERSSLQLVEPDPP